LKKNKQIKPKSNNKAVLIVIAVIVLGGLAWLTLRPSDPAGVNSLQAAALTPTLSPELFKDDPKAQASYQAAKDIPEILAELPCFCGCMKHYGHKNNLFCFSDSHGAGCNVCENIALDAKEMHSRGASIEEIKKAINDRYARLAE
jgi:hypothetical protein